MKYALLAAVGIVVLLVGLGMPATETQTSRTCIDSSYSYGQDCVRTQYEAPNPARGPTIGLGFLMTAVGGLLWLASGSGGGSATRSEGVARGSTADSRTGVSDAEPAVGGRSAPTAGTEGSDRTRAQSSSSDRDGTQVTTGTGSRRGYGTLAERVRAEGDQRAAETQSETDGPDESTTRCPACDAQNDADATHCRYCYADFPATEN